MDNHGVKRKSAARASSAQNLCIILRNLMQKLKLADIAVRFVELRFIYGLCMMFHILIIGMCIGTYARPIKQSDLFEQTSENLCILMYQLVRCWTENNHHFPSETSEKVL